MARVKTGYERGLDGWIRKAAEETRQPSLKEQIEAHSTLQSNPQVTSYPGKKKSEDDPTFDSFMEAMDRLKKRQRQELWDQMIAEKAQPYQTWQGQKETK